MCASGAVGLKNHEGLVSHVWASVGGGQVAVGEVPDVGHHFHASGPQVQPQERRATSSNGTRTSRWTRSLDG